MEPITVAITVERYEPDWMDSWTLGVDMYREALSRAGLPSPPCTYTEEPHQDSEKPRVTFRLSLSPISGRPIPKLPWFLISCLGIMSGICIGSPILSLGLSLGSYFLYHVLMRDVLTKAIKP